MNKPVEVHITQNHIDKSRLLQISLGARYSSPCHCPTALALKEHPDLHANVVLVSHTETRIEYQKDGHIPYLAILQLPRSVRRFISAFDQGRSVSPLRFTLTHPAHCALLRRSPLP